MHKVIVGLSLASVSLGASAAGLSEELQSSGDATQASSPSDAAPDPAAVALLAQQINDAIASQPANATSEQIEGAIAYALQNNPQAASVVLAAIASVANGTKAAPVLLALKDIRALKLREAGNFSTGALAGQTLLTSANGPGFSSNSGSDYIY